MAGRFQLSIGEQQVQTKGGGSEADNDDGREWPVAIMAATLPGCLSELLGGLLLFLSLIGLAL